MDQQSFDAALRETFEGQELKKLSIYQVNDGYYTLSPGSQWCFDGGILLKTDKGQFCIAWEYDAESFNYSFEKSPPELLGACPNYEVLTPDTDHIKSSCGKKIKHLETKWAYYQNYNIDGDLDPEKYFVPTDIIMTLEDDSVLQVATVGYDYNPQSDSASNFFYDFFDNEFLVTLNNVLEIHEEKQT